MLARVFAVDLEALPGGTIQDDFHGIVEYEGAFFQPLGDGGDHVCAKHLEDCEDAGEAGDAIDSENPKADVERVAGVGDDGEGPEEGPGVGVAYDTEGQVAGGFGGAVSVFAPHVDGGWVFAGAAPRPVGDANVAQGCGGKAAAAARSMVAMTSASIPKPAFTANQWSCQMPRSIVRLRLCSRVWASASVAWMGSGGKPRARTKTLAEPVGMTARVGMLVRGVGAGPKSPLMTSLTVPSPPIATTTS